MSPPNPTPCRACGRPATDRVAYVRPTESATVRTTELCGPCAAERLASDPARTRLDDGPLLSEAVLASCAYNEAAAHLRLVAARLEHEELAASLEADAALIERAALDLIQACRR